MCESLILSNFNYCLPVYGLNVNQHNLQRLQLLQNCCVRFSFNVNKYDHITPFYKVNNILKIKERVILRVCAILYKLLMSRVPVYLYSLFNFRSACHTVNVRSSNHLDVPKYNTVKFKGSFVYGASVLYNKFYNLFQCGTSIKAFCAKLKNQIGNYS
jgi:hypothetical protein